MANKPVVRGRSGVGDGEEARGNELVVGGGGRGERKISHSFNTERVDA